MELLVAILPLGEIKVAAPGGVGPSDRKLNASTSLEDKPQVLPSKYKAEE